MPRHFPPHLLSSAFARSLYAAMAAAAFWLLPSWTNAQVTLLVPSQPSIEAPAAKPAPPRDDKRAEQAPAAPELPAPDGNGERKPAAAQGGAAAAAGDAVPSTENADATPRIDEEVDVLISMMAPFRNEGLALDMPQLFAVLRYDDATPAKDGAAQPERRDLLGDVEEIRYLNRKAWGANVALTSPGLYQFIIEGRPWWDAARGRFLRHYVKTILPVHGVERGWDLPVGQHLEIVPHSRPFGLTAPALFAGTALVDGKPLASAPVRMARINVEKFSAPTPWHEEQAARTNARGEFAFVLNRPGWWCCMADMPGDPLKGPDGQPKPLQQSALLWLYVDSPAAAPRKR
ncbi:DUF4198 domain-containing protein [uncultured Desulfovibrio sp.]|uniref:DUF4198 domain-containing protein n=1 Tax=uncultured Desulfovibrio sp. TaxID=167968 RepID=UPI002630BE05|nr:DUF4198 domain-containing protein [uncultured Desulfovibrio sp.]